MWATAPNEYRQGYATLRGMAEGAHRTPASRPASEASAYGRVAVLVSKVNILSMGAVVARNLFRADERTEGPCRGRSSCGEFRDLARCGRAAGLGCERFR